MDSAPHKMRNTLLCLPVLAFLVVFLCTGCPPHNQPYTEIPLGGEEEDFGLTNIRISGDYLPPEGETLPVLVYYVDDVDGSFDFAYIDSTGAVRLKDSAVSIPLGETWSALYLRREKKRILLGRLNTPKEIVELKINALGNIEFRESIPNPNAGGNLYIPINTLAELALLGTNPWARTGKHIQTHNLDMAGTEWEPIGTVLEPFAGIFDGAGKKIENLTVNKPGSDNVGLFGSIGGTGAKLVNITVASGSVAGRENAGALAGHIYGEVTLENCVNAAQVTASGGVAGGIVGLSEGVIGQRAVIRDCRNTGYVFAQTADILGGIAGEASYTDISGCVNEGRVEEILPGSGGGEVRFGGICGSVSETTITACRNTAAVTGHSLVGGIAGYGWSSTITASVNTGAVRGKNTVGGIVGGISGGVSIVRACYNTDSIVSDAFPGGGIAGSAANTSFSACYSTAAASDLYSTGLVGYFDSGSFTGCYWANNYDTNGTEFSGIDWPDGSGDWTTGPGGYWKTLGGFTAGPGGTPLYPVLAWED